jgi:biofilm protein TabA
MILDIFENAHRYWALNPGFAKATEFLLRPDLQELPPGRYEIDGDRLYAAVSQGPGRKREDGLLETHQKYIDIQWVLAGTDEMGWKPKSACKQPSGEYDPQRDVRFFADAPEAWFPVAAGSFVIFYPEDAHLPLISAGQLHKVVVKVPVAPA